MFRTAMCLKDVGIDGEDNVKMDRTALRNGGGGLDTFGLGQGQVMVSCEHSNKRSISIKCSEFINCTWNHLLFEYNFLSWLYDKG
jgi:hypothetical protein